MVHRDLKPANLMIVPGFTQGQPDSTLQSNLKIFDFGSARASFDEANAAGADNFNLTAEGAQLGSPDYVAPEQARNARLADIRADIYSLGCVLFHLLAGQPPFPDTNVVRQLTRHATETPRPLQDFDPSIPEGLQQMVNWMLAKDPAQRYPTPERAAQALQVFLAAGEGAGPDQPNPQMQSYLDWIEVNRDAATMMLPSQGQAAAAPVAPAVSRPAAAPAPAAPASWPAAAQAPPAAPAPCPTVSAPPATPPSQGFGQLATAPLVEADVELMPMESAPESMPATAGGLTPLSRRDYLLLGLGAGVGISGVGLAGSLGWLLARMLRRRSSAEVSE
jgi:hypothetical protein